MYRDYNKIRLLGKVIYKSKIKFEYKTLVCYGCIKLRTFEKHHEVIVCIFKDNDDFFKIKNLDIVYIEGYMIIKNNIHEVIVEECIKV